MTGDWPWPKVMDAVRAKGWTMARLAASHGYNRSLFSNVKRFCIPKAQELIAAAIGMPPHEIWPQRYDSFGRPLTEKSRRPSPFDMLSVVKLPDMRAATSYRHDLQRAERLRIEAEQLRLRALRLQAAADAIMALHNTPRSPAARAWAIARQAAATHGGCPIDYVRGGAMKVAWQEFSRNKETTA